MNTRKDRAKFKNFLILLDIGCSSKIVMIILAGKIFPEKDAVTQWKTKAGNITTNFKVEIDFNLPVISATDVMAWKCHVDDSDNSRYDMILGRDI